jgi:hypothetical protein
LEFNITRGVAADQGLRRASVVAMSRVWRFVRDAPLTYFWLIVLLGTTIYQHNVPRHHLHHFLLQESTNIRHLATDPLQVLFESLLWIDGRYWTPYLVLFTLFLAPAEHWLGQMRWLAVGLTTHVAATYISEGWLYLAIEYRHAAQRLVHTTDIGVSYFLVGVIAVLAYRIATPWRWVYLAVLIIALAVPLVTQFDFTAVGHFSAIFVGLLCQPLTRRRSATPGSRSRS